MDKETRANDSLSSTTIIRPSCFSDETNAAVEKLWTHCSNHAKQLVNFIATNILPVLSGDGGGSDSIESSSSNQKQQSPLSLLDIGAGPGQITLELSPHFTKVEVIEPNQNDAYLKTYAKATPPFVVNDAATFENAGISPHSYNLILCSHVLYYMHVSKWKECLVKMQSGLTKSPPAGRLLLVLTAPRGSFFNLRFLLHPRDRHVQSEGLKLHTGTLCSVLTDIGVQFEVYPQKSCIVVPANLLSEFRDLVRLFALDNMWSAEEWETLGDKRRAEAEEKIEDYIQNICFLKDRNEYKLEIDEDYVVVTADGGDPGDGGPSPK